MGGGWFRGVWHNRITLLFIWDSKSSSLFNLKGVVEKFNEGVSAKIHLG